MDPLERQGIHVALPCGTRHLFLDNFHWNLQCYYQLYYLNGQERLLPFLGLGKETVCAPGESRRDYVLTHVREGGEAAACHKHLLLLL